MPFGLANDGETALLADYFDSGDNTVDLGMYNDSTDSLTDSDNVGDITTEPSNGDYSRQSVPASEVTIALTGGSGELQIDTQTFQVGNETQNVDAWFLYNSADNFFLRGEIDTSSYPNDYINLDAQDNVRLGGEPLQLE